MNPIRPLMKRVAGLRSDTLVMLVCVAGVLLLALAAASGISWLSVNKARNDLLNQGRLLTERYAAQATLALLYGAPDNARAATDNLLRFPNVVGVAVFNADGSILLRQGLTGDRPGQAAASWSADEGTRVLDDNASYWLFGAPVFVGNASQDLAVFGEAVPPPQYQGQVTVAISKAALREVARDIVLSTATITVITAALLLPLLLLILRRISNPIQALARVMARTEAGEITARAQLSGPADVQQMERAFNSMMDRLQDREQELLDARDVALSAARLKAQFTANVSHEIRTPLNGLLGMLQLLREEAPLTAKQLERLTLAEASGNTLLTLINDILDFSRLESGRVEIEHIPFDLRAKVGQIAALFELQTRGKGIALQIDIGPEVPAGVVGDPVRLGQVLTNLIGNAVKFTSAGQVTVQINTIGRSETGARLMFRVTDTGIGIANEDLDRIFQSFTQADSSTTRQFGGSGLGLTITRQLVELMDGQIGVESTPGQGSSFWFSLPLGLAELPPERVLEPSIKPQTRLLTNNPWVLVAEDNATNQLVAKGLLEASGCRVEVVCDGQAAVTGWATGTYAAIFMDCNMPGVDGLEATRRIRASEAPGQRVPIIAMTANTDAELLEQCYAAGMDDALPKPMQLAAVQQLIGKWISTRAVAGPPEPAEVADDAPTVAAVLNTALLAELRDAIGDALPTVIRTFISDSARYFEELRTAIAERDTARIRDLGHTLKGSARNLGAEQLADLADRVERLASGAAPDLAGLMRLSEDFDRQHAAAREAMAQWSSGQLGSKSVDVPQSHFTVLLVEDDGSTRLALRGILDQEGYRVVEAGDGEEAMQLYPRVRPDLVLLDARLPRQDGFTTCRQILALPQAQRTPVLMITSLADEISVERAFRAGAADYITKPINFGVLRRRVTRLLQAGASERHAHRLAYHDVLTGLPNRAGFRERLRQLLERAGNNTKLAVMALDLDRFKVLNESLGHDVADEVLVQLGDRIRRQLRADDLLGRVGSDEFALAFEIETPDTATVLASKILANVAMPLHVGEQELVLSASIGIALYPADDRDLDGLIRHAETALNQAKSAGGGQHHFWQTHMSVAVRRRLDMETDLRKALERSELMLFYQPQMNLGSGMVTSVEALIRWQHPQRGLVSPVDFIPLAEDTGLIGPIGEWVLREACRQNRLWQKHGLPPLRMAVNVSGHQLSAPEFVDTVARALEETDHAPQRLELEITETTLMRNLEASAEVLSRLRSLGVRIAIDDFGTGYSSLGYLKHLPVQTVKIDRSFVAELPENTHDAAITNGIIDMGHNLGLEIVGEGVETAAQMRYLRERGCDIIQGYLLHAPTTPGSIETWLDSNQRPNVAGLGVVKGPRGRR